MILRLLVSGLKPGVGGAFVNPIINDGVKLGEQQVELKPYILNYFLILSFLTGGSSLNRNFTGRL